MNRYQPIESAEMLDQMNPPTPTPTLVPSKAGRPAIHGEPLVRRSIGMTKAEYDRLRHIAWRDRVSFPELVRRALARLE